MARPLLVALILVAVLTACGLDETPRSEGPDVDFAKSLIADLQARKFDAVEARMDPAARTERSRSAMAQIAEVFPPTLPSSIRVAGWKTTYIKPLGKPRTQRVALALEYRFADKWFVASFAWRRNEGEPIMVERVHIEPIPDSLETINRFTFEGRGALHYVVFALAIALPVFSLSVLLLCLATPMRWWRKTLWVLGILFGLATLRFNWTDGTFDIQPLSARMLSAGYIRAGQLGPYVLLISVPLFAIIFLVKRLSGMYRAGETQPLAPSDR